MFYQHKGKNYILNLIDTPGHVDFSYEVSRSLSACEGVLLLIDASQGIQAQTLANFMLASKAGLTIIPVINKIDLPSADIPRVCEQIESSLGIESAGVICVSGKTGKGCAEVLEAVVERIPAPKTADRNAPLKCLLFDTWFDTYRGVVCLVRLMAGTLKQGDKVLMKNTGKWYEVQGQVQVLVRM
jgi:small GTP-binding protein